MGKTLERMRANPRGDWQIGDVEKACREAGALISKPASGSHFKVRSDKRDDHLTIPARRPIKVVYIRKLVDFLTDVMEG